MHTGLRKELANAVIAERHREGAAARLAAGVGPGRWPLVAAARRQPDGPIRSASWRSYLALPKRS
jgi:hypothetical protein